jgi:hypothetical protein
MELSARWRGLVKPLAKWLNGYDSIRRRIIRFSNMTFAPLVLRILENRELLRRQQRLDSNDGCVSVWLETGPDLLQLRARGLNS